jgi:hypothetical protein
MANSFWLSLGIGLTAGSAIGMVLRSIWPPVDPPIPLRIVAVAIGAICLVGGLWLICWSYGMGRS